MVFEAIEKLRTIKLYRTPQGLRSFCRLFSVFLPPFYAPFYAQLAHELNSLGTAIAFAIITSIALTALFETVNQMEDPFQNGFTLDGIDVYNELDILPEIRELRNQVLPVASTKEAN